MEDFIYPGFLKAFGCDLFNELRNKLLETDDLYNIRFVFFEADMGIVLIGILNFLKILMVTKKLFLIY